MVQVGHVFTACIVYKTINAGVWTKILSGIMTHLARNSRVQQDTATLASSSSGAEASAKRESHASHTRVICDGSARDHGEAYEHEAAAA